jgi:polysaccharide deacetylase family protein (PEP-CTERM system associated)
VPSTPALSQWEALPSRVERNFLTLLELFGEFDVHVTCFFLGWVAKRFPHLVREAARQGHEIASHGYAHKLVYEITRDEFYHDAVKSREILEDITGHSILGYRSSGFSVTEKTLWFFESVAQAGYRYDSSVFPAARGHGGWKSGRYAPYVVPTDSGGVVEFPLTVTRVLGQPMCFFGGGYLRLFPFSLTKKMTLKVLGEGRPVVFYIHPREIDPDHPRLPMNLKREFKTYVNLKTTAPKIKSLLSEFEFTTFERFMEDNAEQLGTGRRVAPATQNLMALDTGSQLGTERA